MTTQMTTNPMGGLLLNLTIDNRYVNNPASLERLNSIIAGTANKNAGSNNYYSGSAADDVLNGRGNDDVLVGNAGNDTLQGQGGNDVLMGNAGNDRLYGDGGDDHLLYQLSANPGSRDLYDGGANSRLGDTLWLALTWGEYAACQQEIAQVRSLMGAKQGINYDFTSFGLSIRNIENLEVLLTNRAPTAAGDLVTTDEDHPLTFNVLGNDTDPDAKDVLSVVSWDASSVKGGTLAYNGDGTFTFDPDAGYESLAEGESDNSNSFTYTIRDLAGATATAKASITITGVNDAPIVAAALTSQTDEDQAPYIIDLLEGASDVDHNAKLHAINIREINGLTAGWEVVGDTIEVTPGAYSNMSDGESTQLQFAYEIADEHGATVNQTLQVDITGVNDAPVVASALMSKTDEDQQPYVIQLLAEASDIDHGAVLHAEKVREINGRTEGWQLVGDTIEVTPGAYSNMSDGESAQLQFAYEIADEHGATVNQTLQVDITGVNDAPVVASALMSKTDEDQQPYVIQLLAGASDVDHNAKLHAINIREINGLTAGWEVVGDTIVLTPGAYSDMNDGESAQLQFAYEIADEYGASVDQTLQVDIAGITDGPPLEISIAQGESANEFLLTILTKELIGIDRVHVGFQGLPKGVKVSPLNSPNSDPATLLRDFVGNFGETETFKVTLPTDADVFEEFKVTAEGYRHNEKVTGTTLRAVDIDYDVAQSAARTLTFGMEDQSIWGDFTGAIDWHEYIPIIGGEALVWDEANDEWAEATGDSYWRSGEINLIDFHVSTAESVQAASDKLNSISGVVAAWGDYLLDKTAYELADFAWDAAELADDVLESALATASSWKSSAQSAYSNTVAYKNQQYNELMATAYEVRGLFGEYWFTWYDPIQAAEYAAAEVAVGATWTNLQAANVSYDGAYWALTNNNRYVVDPLMKLAQSALSEMNASLAKATTLENAMHDAGYYTDLSYADDTLLALSGAAALAGAEYAAAQLAATMDFSADLQLDAEVCARLGLQIDCVLDSGTVDAEVEYEVTSRTQYNQTTDMLTILPELVNLTTGSTVAFSTESPNVKFSAALVYDVGADLNFMVDGRLAFAGEEIFDISPNSDGIRLDTSVSLDDLAYQELDLDGDGDIDAVLDTAAKQRFQFSDVDDDGELDGVMGLGVDLGRLVLVEFDSATDLDPIEVPLVDSLTSGILKIEVALPYVETEGTLETSVTPADFYDEGAFVEVDFSEISSAFFNMLDARIDFGEEFMETYGLTSLTDEQTLQGMFASIANGVMGLIFDQLDGQSEGMPIFVIDTTDETDTSLLHLNLWEDPEVGASAGSFGFYTAYGESDPIVKATLDLDQLVAVIVNKVVFNVLTGGAYEGVETVTNLPIINPLNIDVSIDTLLKLAYVDGAVADEIKKFVDFGYTFEAADFDVNAAANFGQKFGFSIDDMTYVIALEDGKVFTFDASDADRLTIADASTHDQNGDGSINYAFEIIPTAMFSNDTELGFSLGYTIDFLKGSLAAALKLPIEGLGEIPLPGIDIEVGPLLRVEGEIDTLDIDVFETRFGVDVGTGEFDGSVDIQLVGAANA